MATQREPEIRTTAAPILCPACRCIVETTPEQRDVLSGELSNIMKMIEELNAVNTEGVEPLTSVIDMDLPMRADIVTDGGIASRILQNAPEQMADFFVVPKVVE